MRDIAKGIVLAACLMSTAALAAGWPERALSHAPAHDVGSRANERMRCEFAAVPAGAWTATFARGQCEVDNGRLTFVPADAGDAPTVTEKRIALGDVRTASHQSRKLKEQLQLTTRDEVIALNVLADDGGRKSREHAIDLWAALRNAGVTPVNGTRVVDTYPTGATTW
ncbi:MULTISPECIES: hypothetical protein [Burkholderia]|uniref:hypothetical protein n=1 Tax=unclassified Burkholderia TaxID=2613784 RepID=UPI000B7A878C|nr:MULTISPECIES: hypothetical protein [unclassified Burkholderia]RQU20057.1 hypothetical protein DF152_08415 [Burkholderia cenocepacia]MBR8235489.1 hypothetical protein [Burkholderia sp. AU32357]MBY4874585.1 hypothetical protein [Burkholderia sp. AU42008]OXI40119.1 hypothetical protein CFB49_18660 [Burkholderia sp. AU17457]RQU28245.1 hypothetical protein DF153_03880 [Burkholderia cenocepacia]